MGYLLQKLHTATFLCFCDNRIPLCKHSNLKDFHKNHVTEIRITSAEYWKNVFWFTKILVKNTWFLVPTLDAKWWKRSKMEKICFWRFATKKQHEKYEILTIWKIQKRYLRITHGLKISGFYKKSCFPWFLETFVLLAPSVSFGVKNQTCDFLKNQTMLK